MRFGCCASMLSPQTDPIGIESIEVMREMEFDYIELSLAHITELDSTHFDALLHRIDRSGIRCEACNNFFPPRIRLTGPDHDFDTVIEYTTRALTRAGQLGVDVVVLGSSGAKNIPDGFPESEAWDQIVKVMRSIGPLAEKNNLVIVIEPISRPEANFILTAAEGLRLMQAVDHPNVRLLIDYFHLMNEQEHPDIVSHAGDAVRHLHFARPEDRNFPREREDAYDVFFGLAHQAGYTGRCSIEAFTKSFSEDGPRALQLLKAITSRIQK